MLSHASQMKNQGQTSYNNITKAKPKNLGTCPYSKIYRCHSHRLIRTQLSYTREAQSQADQTVEEVRDATL